MSDTTAVATQITCAFCEGAGTAVDSGTPCLKCRGKGIISKRSLNGIIPEKR